MQTGAFQNIVAGMASAIELWPQRTRLVIEVRSRIGPRPSVSEGFRRDQENIAGDMQRVMGRLDARQATHG
jgi:hypothetical protein